jgi:hypothetical protein
MSDLAFGMGPGDAHLLGRRRSLRHSHDHGAIRALCRWLDAGVVSLPESLPQASRHRSIRRCGVRGPRVGDLAFPLLVERVIEVE